MKKIIVAMLLIVVSLSLFAQESETITAEERFFATSLKVQIIESQANSADRSMKMLAIQDVEQMLEDDGTLDENTAGSVVEILNLLGTEGTDRVMIQNGLVINDFPYVRREACRLLGDVGEFNPDMASEALTSIIEVEEEAMVLSQAVLSISRIPYEPNDAMVTLSNISQVMYNQRAVEKDITFANAYLIAVYNLAQNLSNDVEIDDVLQEVLAIADSRSGYPPSIRATALELLSSLKDMFR